MALQRTLAVLAAVGFAVGVATPAQAGNAAAETPTFYEDVLPILQANCQTCHRPVGQNIGGLVAPMSLTSYAETRPWARSIASKVEAREMPPWFASGPAGAFANERGLTDAEIDIILRWVDAGAPAGDADDAPPAKQWVEEANAGWSLGTPDFTVQSPEPYLVDDDIYDLNISFFAPLTEAVPEDTWIRGWEFRTGTEGVVHHMCAFVMPPSGPVGISDGSAAAGADTLGQMLGCIAEGAESGMLPEGFGVLIEKGSTLVFNMHYHKEPADGSGVWSRPEVGFFVTDEPVKYKVRNDFIPNAGFEIPPNHPRYRIGTSRLLEKDTLVLTYWPHAHLRATAARYTAIYPDGTEELLLDVPHYDQNWQETYRYKEPKLLPRGTRIDVDFWYDNTPERAARRDFDPNRSIGHGNRTDDEMALAFIGYAEIEPASAATNDQN